MAMKGTEGSMCKPTDVVDAYSPRVRGLNLRKQVRGGGLEGEVLEAQTRAGVPNRTTVSYTRKA